MRRDGCGAKIYGVSLLLACVTAGISGVAMAQVSQSPLSLTEGVPPNMIFTLDDSGSMRWAFAPDDKNGVHASRRAKSNTFNPIYYDPAVRYVAPKIVGTDGSEIQLATTFTSAYHNGFDTARGSANLSNNYKVTWTYDLSADFPTSYGYSSTSPRLADNPAPDFGAASYDVGITLTSSGSGRTHVAEVNGESITLRRESNNSCSVTPAVVWLSCSRVSGNNYSYTVFPTRFSTALASVGAYYYRFNTSLSGCLGSNDINNESCYERVFVTANSGIGGTDERQNFANWYSFYRNRALATLSAASLAFFDLSPAVRLTWQGLGNCKSLNGGDTSNCKDNKFREFSSTHKGQFYDWLKSVSFNQSTLLPEAMKRAGEFLKGDVAWRKFPQTSAGSSNPVYACRPSYHVAMTDGFWNSTTADPDGYQQDQNNISLPDGKQYSGQHPFYDSTTQTLADLAMHYWATDLRPGVDNGVPAYIPFKSGNENDDYWDPRNDPATWQHMVNFMMGLGLTESLNNASVPWGGGTFEGTGYTALKNGTANWPAASSGSSNNVYDLWHAAINSRGEFFSVDSPDAMVQAFKEIMSRISERNGTAASPAINSGQLEEVGDSLVSYSFQTYYYSDEAWAGDLKGFTKRRQINSVTGQYEVVTEQDWSARNNLEERTTARNILMAGSGSTGLQSFTWGNAGDADTAGTLASLLRSDPDNVASPNNTAADAEKRLEFLRGSRDDEGTLFRTRSSILGDMVSSKPVSVRGARYLTGYANSVERNTSYGTFLTTQQTRTPHIYVGANDGMLHAFNALTGVETFAFVPTAVFPNLHRLTGKTYSHQFYVDGTPVVADAYITVGGTKQWRTVLVGTLRAGGKGLFALDITDPANPRRLWEFSDASIPAVDGTNNRVRLGYSFPQPTIARLHNGKWAVVTGNGYDSDGNTHGRAALLIIDLETGALTKSIEVQGASGVANGMSSPRLADMNVDGIADYAYVGDMQGNLWRFNLTPDRDVGNGNPFTREATESSAVESDFVASYGGKPIFKAVAAGGQPQPITAAPNIVRHPSRLGYLILVGTGKYYETPDKSGTVESQSVYGIWDTNTRSTSGDETGPGGVTTGTLARSQLQKQTFEPDVTNPNIRTLTRNPVNWAIPPATAAGTWTDNDGHKYGWYFDLTQQGEMVIENMTLFGQTLLLQALVPEDDPCNNGVANWTYGIDTQTGGRTRHHIFINIRESENPARPVAAIRQVGEGGLTLGQRPDGQFEVCTGEHCESVEPDPESIGRQSWRRAGDE